MIIYYGLSINQLYFLCQIFHGKIGDYIRRQSLYGFIIKPYAYKIKERSVALLKLKNTYHFNHSYCNLILSKSQHLRCLVALHNIVHYNTHGSLQKEMFSVLIR